MEIKTIEPTKSLAISVTIPAENLSQTIGALYGEIGAYMQRKGITMSGAPYVLYHNMDMQALQIEAGFPVAEEAEEEGRIRMSGIPGGKFVHCIHTGPYAELEKTYEKVMAFIKEKKLETKEWMFESYINSPENTPPEELKTELWFPL